MHRRLLFLISRRLHIPTFQLSSIRRSSLSSTQNLSIFNRQRHVQQPFKQNPSHSFVSIPNSESNPNPNPNSQSNLQNSGPTKLELHPNPNPNLVTDASPGIDACLPEEVEKRIWAVERLSKGKKYAKRDMKQNRVPGFVCLQDSPDTEHVLVVMDKFQIQSLWSLLGEEMFLCTVFTLEVFDGFGSNNLLYQERVLPRRINFDKCGEISNVGFTRAPPGMKMRLDVPIRINGQENCTGLRKGGILKVYLSYVSLFCLPEELPSCVEVHVNGMDIGDRICLGDLGVPLHSKSQPLLPICEIIKVHE